MKNVSTLGLAQSAIVRLMFLSFCTLAVSSAGGEADLMSVGTVARADAANPFVKVPKTDLPVSQLVADPDRKDTAERMPKVFENVGVVEKLGSTLDLNRTFTNENGEAVTLASFADGKSPLLVTLNYFSCANLCSLQLNGLLAGLKAMPEDQRKELRIVTVSFDEKDTPALAKAKRDEYLATIEGEKPEWHFLVANERHPSGPAALAEAFGFQYRWDAESNQYAHTAAIFFVSPRGVVSRYLYGIEYSARDLRFAWIDASEGRLGGVIEKVILRCFHYEESTGKYTPFAFRVVRIGGLVTVSFLGLMLGVLMRRDKKRGLAGGWDRVA